MNILSMEKLSTHPVHRVTSRTRNPGTWIKNQIAFQHWTLHKIGNSNSCKEERKQQGSPNAVSVLRVSVKKKKKKKKKKNNNDHMTKTLKIWVADSNHVPNTERTSHLGEMLLTWFLWEIGTPEASCEISALQGPKSAKDNGWNKIGLIRLSTFCSPTLSRQAPCRSCFPGMWKKLHTFAIFSYDVVVAAS